MTIRKMKSWEFRKAPRFDEKSHPYIFVTNISCLEDKEIWRSLVAVGKSTPPGPLQSLAKWMAPNFNLTCIDLKEHSINATQRFINRAHYDELKTVARKILTLAKYHEVH